MNKFTAILVRRHGEADLIRGGFKRVIPKHDLEVGQFCEAVFEPETREKGLARIKPVLRCFQGETTME